MLCFSSAIYNIPCKVSEILQFVSIRKLIVIVQFKFSKLLLRFSQLLYLINHFGIVFHLLHVEVKVKLRVIDVDFQVYLDLLVTDKWIRVL